MSEAPSENAPDAAQAGRNESPVLAGSTLFRQRAERRPQALALADRADRAAFGMEPGRTYSYGEADRAIDALCRFFADHGLEPGDTVGVQMPNVAETVLIYLAAWRSGLTVAAFPHLWHKTEVAEACATLDPAALIGAGTTGDGTVTEILRETAAMHFSVRLVAGFGPGLPDGIADLGRVFSEDDADGDASPVAEHHSYAPALITFTARPGHPLLPVPHSCETLLAQGAMTVLALGLNADDRILNAFPLSGPTGLTLGLMPWLVSGGVLIQHHAFDAAVFAQQVGEAQATVTALPAPVLSAFSKRLTVKQAMSLKRIGRVIHACRASAPAPSFGGFSPILFDVHALGDLACVLLTYMDGADASLLPRGKLTLAAPEKEGVVFVETALSKSNNAEVAELLLRGPAVACGHGHGPITPDGRGFVGTGIPCLPEPAPEPLLRLKRDPELIHLGAVLVSASELDRLYGSFPACEDAACFAVPDPVLGERVCAALVAKPGQSVRRSSLHWFLKSRQVASYKMPEDVIEVPRIPRRPDGRVMRERLAAHLTDERDPWVDASETAEQVS
ncbi:Enterobactin synthase component E [Methyloligella halotolerans]|uniref:Enterobactin synthase component E n=1 Tax=Methyloligella halotolerans TaxID=1177755 RepID=A0A1E2S2C7_9HYPH|nr:class I adenylate-forming enzyme family protein [Methyloligella halotolerans]ODA68637.1 Enterobactin synthase component E [Methyloligella halotolerans]